MGVQAEDGPTWSKDIIPYFLPVYIYIFSHIIYFTTGNLFIAIWLLYIIDPIVTALREKGASDMPNVPPS
jgi:hypothetical protein